MFASSEVDEYNRDTEFDPRCEACGCSMVARFGLPILSEECESCEADWEREVDPRNPHGGAIEVCGADEDVL